MLTPTGPHAAAVYWRRRLVLLGAVLVVILVGYNLFGSSGGGRRAAAAPTHGAATSAAPAVMPTTSPVVHPSTSTSVAKANAPAKAKGHVAVPPKPCGSTQLRVSAATGASTYRTGAQPVLILQVVDVGPKACVQNLADSVVELRVYNGESRVWGSHDCQIQPGTLDQTLAVRQPVRVTLTWSGLSSQPGCKSQRQRVGAGTYTVYPLLAGRLGAAAQFSIT